jgi:hypothetical protein
MASKIILARGNTENVAAVLISDGAPDTLCEKRKLVVRGPLAHAAAPPLNARSTFASQSLFRF